MVSLLFRVERAEPRTAALKVHEVLLLEPSSPLAQPVLSRAADRSFVLMGTRSAAESGPALAALAPVFEPMFKSFDFQLKELPEDRRGSPAPRWLQPDILLLPDRTAQEGSAVPAAVTAVPEHRLRAVVRKGLTDRQLTRQVALDGPVPEEVVRTRFRALVSPAGHVTWALPLHEEARFVTEVDRLRDALGRLRFQPKAAAAPEWAELQFVWEPWPEK
jgi:hypothetical protein